MKKNRELKKPAPFADSPAGDGSIWELVLFAVFFIVIFSAVSRANAQTNTAPEAKVEAPAAANGEAITKKTKSSKKGKKARKASGSPTSIKMAKAGATTVSASTASATELASQTATTAAPAGQTAALVTEAPATSTSPYKFGAQLSVGTAASMDPNSVTRYSGSYTFRPGIRYAPLKMRAGAGLSYSQEYSHERDDGTNGSLENPSLSLSKAWDKGADFNSNYIDAISMSLSGVIPVTNDSRKRTLRGTLGPSVKATKGVGRVTFGQSFGYSRSFFEYDIRDDGVVNSPDSFSSTTELGLKITDKLSFNTLFRYGYTISFQGVGRGSERTAFSMDYSISSRVFASLGVDTSRGTLAFDGQSDRLKFFDQEAATAFFDLGMSL
jgi:hypothetical protein